MKYFLRLILIPAVWLLVPVAFIVVAFDVAKAWTEQVFEDYL
jgi:hypothetical protein